MQKVVCFIGRSNSCKGEVARYLANMVDWPLISMGETQRLDRHIAQPFSGTPGIIFSDVPRSATEAEFLNNEFNAVFIWLYLPEDHDNSLDELYQELVRAGIGFCLADGAQQPLEVAKVIESAFHHWLNQPSHAEFQDFGSVPDQE